MINTTIYKFWKVLGSHMADKRPLKRDTNCVDSLEQ